MNSSRRSTKASTSTVAAAGMAGSEKVNYRCPSNRDPSQTRSSTRQAAEIESEENCRDEYLVLNLTLLTSFMNCEMTNHLKFSNCNNPNIQLVQTEKRIISTSMKLKCLNCTYEGSPYKFYRETQTNKPGPKPSTLNNALGYALVNASPKSLQQFSVRYFSD